MNINNKEEKISKNIEEITGKKPEINQELCYDLSKEYRTYKIRKIILLSSSFDYFTLEEEGRLSSLLEDFYSFGDENPPKIVHVETEKKLINRINNENFDLIIFFNKPTGEKINSLSHQIAQNIEIPIVFLGSNFCELKKYDKTNFENINKFFTWNGDGKIILSIINYFEDKKNIESSYFPGKKIILLVEDSIQYYSSYLSLINDEIYGYLEDIINNTLTCEQKILRFKRRPLIIHVTKYEQAEKTFLDYKDNLISVILDNNLDEKDKSKSGLKLARDFISKKPDLPILIQSSESVNKKEIKNSIITISKSSTKLIKKIRCFIRKSLGSRKIIFEDKKGKTVFEASNLRDFEKALKTLDDEIILECANKNLISKWLDSIGEIELSNRCKNIEDDFDNIKEFKNRIKNILDDYKYSINQISISSFQRNNIVDPQVKINRIGSGALGGKARGIAFLAKILSKYVSEDTFPDLRITVPRSIVLSTDIFDIFMDHNNLSDIEFSNYSDERIASKFVKSDIPAIVLGDLRSFIRNIRKPLIIRSSGLLEDSLMQPFAGIYSSMLLPNESWETDLRFKEVCNAIKYVYASTYFEKSRNYIKSTPKHIGDEKMAVLIQEIVGEKHGDYFYPTISGVAKSYNYYPSGPCKPEDGICYLALGLGKAIVDGGSSYAFCPERPKAPLFGTPKDYMKFSQNYFYSLKLESIYRIVNKTEETSLEKLDIDIAKKHNVLDKITSTYIPEDDKLYPGLYERGYPVIDFAPIIDYDELPLAKAIKLLLKISEIVLGYPVEIEFALNLSNRKEKPSELVILQIRSMIPPDKKIDVDLDKISEKDIVVKSNNALGYGVFSNLKDILYVDQSSFDMSNSSLVVNEIRKINSRLIDKKKSYILIGPGRWGSQDPWLGIPVVWSDIARAKIIIETPYKERSIESSQGSHFFHDMIASEIGYLITEKPEDIKWDFIKKSEIVEETKYIKHVCLKDKVQAIIDGRKGKAIIKKQKKNEE